MIQLTGEPGRTAYDLNFSVLGIPVRVHPFFWLVALLLGGSNPDLKLVAVWVVCLFVSILVHELGHALSARSYGWPPTITLHGFGGVARYSPTFGYTRARAIWITFAGPFAGFCLFGIVAGFELLLVRALKAEQPWATTLRDSNGGPAIAFAIAQLKWINLMWGLFNLLPVVPLDGGQICGELLNARSSHKGRIRACQIGMVTAAVVAVWFVNSGMVIGGLMFGSLAYDNYQRYSQYKRGW